MMPDDGSRAPLSRRDFIKNLAASGAFLQAGPAQVAPTRRSGAKRIDRQVLVRRHSPVNRKCDPLSPLSVGNGEFAFTADITGLQTFPEEYDRTMPLCTMSQWGWHTTPRPAELRGRNLRLTSFESNGRKVGYAVDSEGQTELYKWLRENPHRLHLGLIGFRFVKSGTSVRAGDLSDIEQRLDLWTGLLTSRFRCLERQVSVTTAVDPSKDLIAVSIESELIAQGLLQVRFAFPYGSPEMRAADWGQPARHKSELQRVSPQASGCGRRAADVDRKKPVFAKRAQLAAARPPVLFAGKWRAFVCDCDDGRGLAFGASRSGSGFSL